MEFTGKSYQISCNILLAVHKLGGRGIWQMMALLHKPIFSKMGDKGKGQVKNRHLWTDP